MGQAEQQLGFSLDENTQSYVSQETGIPQSTISYVSRGLRELPLQYHSAMRAFYEREAYRRLVYEGAPSSQANRFKWYSVSTVRGHLAALQEIMRWYMGGLVYSKLKALDHKPSESELFSIQEESLDTLKASARASNAPLEDITEGKWTP